MLCDIYAVMLRNCPVGTFLAGVSCPQTSGIEHTRTTLCDIRTAVLRDCPAGTFLAEDVPVNHKLAEWAHTGIAEGALRHTNYRILKLPCRDVSRENSVPVQLRTFRVEVLHPFTEQSTYDARSPTRKRTVNDESGSAPYVCSCIYRSNRPVSAAIRRSPRKWKGRRE